MGSFPETYIDPAVIVPDYRKGPFGSPGFIRVF